MVLCLVVIVIVTVVDGIFQSMTLLVKLILVFLGLEMNPSCLRGSNNTGCPEKGSINIEYYVTPVIHSTLLRI